MVAVRSHVCENVKNIKRQRPCSQLVQLPSAQPFVPRSWKYGNPIAPSHFFAPHLALRKVVGVVILLGPRLEGLVSKVLDLETRKRSRFPAGLEPKGVANGDKVQPRMSMYAEEALYVFLNISQD